MEGINMLATFVAENFALLVVSVILIILRRRAYTATALLIMASTFAASGLLGSVILSATILIFTYEWYRQLKPWATKLFKGVESEEKSRRLSGRPFVASSSAKTPPPPPPSGVLVKEDEFEIPNFLRDRDRSYRPV